MPNKLMFYASDVAQVIADAKNAKLEQLRPTLEQLVKGVAYDENSN